jgi:hypothetical protein
LPVSGIDFAGDGDKGGAAANGGGTNAPGSTDGNSSTTAGGGDAVAVESVPYCQQACNVWQDCALDILLGEPGFTEANWSCDAGACSYHGCASDEECPASGSGTLAKCVPHEVAGKSFGMCTYTCQAAGDCVVAAVGSQPPLYDEDNWSCNAGLCEHKGCLNNAECQTATGQDYVCRDVADDGSPAYCIEPCEKSEDCQWFSTGNYECRGGYCLTKGCEGDADCSDQAAAAGKPTSASRGDS